MMNDQIPLPFLFNPLKHHLGWILWFIGSLQNYDLYHLKSLLRKTGNSQMDLYFGAMSIASICKEIKFINIRYIEDKDDYIKYVLKYNFYTLVTVSDTSSWVLKIGDDPTRYIHLHPARYSPQTIRIKANTLKSFIAALVIYGPEPGLSQINHVRREVLGLSPIKRVSSSYGIGKLMKLSKSPHFDRFDPYETSPL